MMSHRRYWIFGLIWSVCSGQAGNDDQQQMLDLRFSLRGLGLTKIDIINFAVSSDRILSLRRPAPSHLDMDL